MDGCRRLVDCETLLVNSASLAGFTLTVPSPDDGKKTVDDAACPGTVKCVEFVGVIGCSDEHVVVMDSSLDACSRESSVDVDGRLVDERSVPQYEVATTELIRDRIRFVEDISSHTPLVRYVIDVMDMAEYRLPRAPFTSRTTWGLARCAFL